MTLPEIKTDQADIVRYLIRSYLAGNSTYASVAD